MTTTLTHKRPNLLDAVNFVVDQIDGVVIILGSLTLAGVIAGLWRLCTGLGAATHLSDGIAWGVWIGFDFSLIAFAGCGFTMAGTVYILRLEQFRPALRPAILAGFLGYAAVLVLLLLDLGRPDRFYFFLFNYNLHSPLFEICWCVLLYTCVLTIEISPMIFDRLHRPQVGRAIHKIIVPVAIAAVTLSSLHQSTLGTLYLNMPYRLQTLWYTPVLPVLFFVSSVAIGLSVAILMYYLASRLSRRPAAPGLTAGLARGVAGAALVYLVVRCVDLIATGKGGLLLAFDRDSLLVWAELALMAIIPAALFLNARTRNSRACQEIGALLVILGTLLNRFDATLFAQMPPSGAQYTPHLVEWLTTIGVIAGAALAWYLGVKFLAVIERGQARPQRA